MGRSVWRLGTRFWTQSWCKSSCGSLRGSKNGAAYKNPLKTYFERHDYAFKAGDKTGFSPAEARGAGFASSVELFDDALPAHMKDGEALQRNRATL